MPQWLQNILDWFRPRPVPVPPGPPVPGQPITAAAIVTALNAERTSHRLAPLAEYGPLNTSAQDWARSMALHGVLTHGDFAARINHVLPGASAAENIAAGQATVSAVVASWMASPGHRGNVLGNYDLCGAGFAKDAGGMLYWVADFATDEE